MRTITVDDEVYTALFRNAVGFNDSENNVMRRLLKLDVISQGQQPLTNERPAGPGLTAFVKSQEFQNCRQGVDRFLLLLSYAYSSNPEKFIETAIATATRGTRRHFGMTRGEVELSGQQIVAKLIPGSPIWTLTAPIDNKTKRGVLGTIFICMGFSRADVVYVKSQVPDTNIRRYHGSTLKPAFASLLEKPDSK